MFSPSAGQMAGQLGQVVRLEDPVHDPEFVVVRFGKDELGFAPADLLVPPKRMPVPPKRMPVPRTPEVTASPQPEVAGPPLLPPVPKSTRKTTEALPVDLTMEKSMDKPVEKVTAPRKAAKAKPGAELTVTLACQEGQWSVQATRGTKVVTKPVPVRSPDALAMVALLDIPAVRDVVDEMVSAARLAAESEAVRLRAQLAEVEARLAELPA
ncbi:MAG: hypothetical protein H0T78_01665 [Longispora sp.]|nr:hypothetical protein [Longispora sp. (in: high G+C Gram-positive bacteria)]